MKRICLLCIVILLCSLKCYAQDNAERVAFSYGSDINYSDDCSSIWNTMKESCSYIFFYENGEIKPEKGDRIYRKDNSWYLQWGKNVIEDMQMEKMFDITIYNEAISKYSGKNSEVKELIYDFPLYRVFALTEENIYVITGCDEVWNNTASDFEVYSLMIWVEMNSKNIPMQLYVNNILIDETAYMGKDNASIPLRAVLESMGKKVEWLEETQEVIINDKICLKLDNMNKIITALYIDSDNSIQIADWSKWGSYSILEDSIYLFDSNMSYLLRLWDYNLTLNIPKREIRIFTNINQQP